jgi:hypothetical protein
MGTIVPLVKPWKDQRLRAGGEERPGIEWKVERPGILRVVGVVWDSIGVVSKIDDDTVLGLKECYAEWMQMLKFASTNSSTSQSTSKPAPTAKDSSTSLPEATPPTTSEEKAYTDLWLDQLALPPSSEPPILSSIKSWAVYMTSLLTYFGPKPYKKSPRLSSKSWEYFLAFLFLLKAQQCRSFLRSDIEDMMAVDGLTEDCFPNVLRNVDGYLSLVEELVAGRRIVLSKDRGGICWAPKSAEVGDVVCLLKGGRMPCVLRRGQGKEGSYQFVGEAFVMSVMSGDAVLTHEDGWSDFELE